jgi:hypothetical protein
MKRAMPEVAYMEKVRQQGDNTIQIKRMIDKRKKRDQARWKGNNE